MRSLEEKESAPWCPVCPTLAIEDAARLSCPCRSNTPTHAIQIALEPIPSGDLRVAAQMLRVKLLVGREQVRRAREEVRANRKWNPSQTKLDDEDARLWRGFVRRTDAELSNVLSKIVASTKTAQIAPQRTPGPTPRRATPRARKASTARPTSTTTRSATRASAESATSMGPPGDDGPPPPNAAPSSEVASVASSTARGGAPEAPLSREKRALLERTLGIWQPRTSRNLSLDDAREILENSLAFVRLLDFWAKRAKTKDGPA